MKQHTNTKFLYENEIISPFQILDFEFKILNQPAKLLGQILFGLFSKTFELLSYM